MDAQNYDRKPQKFICTGIDLNHPVDLVSEGKFPFLQNVRGTGQLGRIDTRAGLIRIGAGPQNNIHTIMRMNDYVFNEFVRFVGSGTALCLGGVGSGSFPTVETGFSGNPMSVVPYRPEQSPRVWGYVADQLKMRKVDSDGVSYQMGVAPPITMPSAELTQPLYYAPAVFDPGGGWGGTNATVPSFGSRLSGVTIGTILYLTGSTGWALIAPSGGNPDSVVPGMRLIINAGGGSAEVSTVETIHQVFAPVASPSITLASILYDDQVANTGLCTITLSQQLNGISRNTLITINGENVRIISITPATTGVQNASFRLSTTGTHSVGESVSFFTQGNVFIYLQNSHSAGEPLTANMLTSTISGGSAGQTGSFYTNAGGGGPFNLGTLPNGIPLQPDDYIHVGVYIDHPEYLVEGKLVLDCDPNTTVTHSAIDGNQQAYYRTFRQNDLQPTVLSTETADQARTNALQLQAQNSADVAFATSLNGAIAPELQTGSAQQVMGQAVWTEFIWKVSEFYRVGSNPTADLSKVFAIQFRVTVAANVTLNISVHNLWIGGGFGPDSFPNLQPFVYRFRYRSSVTGAKSLPSPPMRTGIEARRQSIALTLVTSTDPQVDKIDIERLGGPTAESGFHYFQTINNSSPTFTDNQDSSAIVVNPGLDTDVFQPFPIQDLPKTSVVSVSGTAVKWISGDQFNISWAAGTEVIINGDVTALFAPPTSPTLMHVQDSMDSGTSINQFINEPTLTGQPLPVMWGPFYDVLFACGNIFDMGSVYFTKTFDPDSAPDANRIEVTSSSEAMMNGCLYDGRCYSWSDRRLFGVVPSSGTSQFQFTEVRNGKGLVNRWAFTVGPKIWFVANDGVYETDGGEPVFIAFDIRPLFPKGDSPGTAVNGLNPIDMTKSIRLGYHNNFLYMDYTDVEGAVLTLVYDTVLKGWFPDSYFQGENGIVVHYEDKAINPQGIEITNILMGTALVGIYEGGGTTDGGISINGVVQTPAFNAGDTRAKKQFGDLVVDIDPNNTPITITPWIDNYATSLPTTTFTNPTRYIPNPIEFNNGDGMFAKNLALEFSWSSGDSPVLYYWEPSYLPRPEDTFLRATDWGDAGYPGDKFVQGFILTVDTGGVGKAFRVELDGVPYQDFTATHTGEQSKPYVFTAPKDGTLLRIIGLDENFWRFFQVRWVFEPSPEYVTIWQTQGTTHDIPGYQFLKDGYIAHRSTQDVLLEITVDGINYTFDIPNSGGVYAKTYLVFTIPVNGRTLKGKLFTYRVSSSSPFQLFQKDCEVRVHAWDGGGYQTKKPFGDVHRNSGARI